MSKVKITLTARFVCPVCKEVVTVEKPKPLMITAMAGDDYTFQNIVTYRVTCPHCGEEYEGEA